MVAIALGLEMEGLCEDFSQDGWQELVIRDVLDLSTHNLPALLVQSLLVPVRVDCLEEGGDPVVFPH